MLPVKKKTIEVSYLETKQFVIPSFLIPVHYLKGAGIFISCLFLFVLSSYNNSVKVNKFEEVGTQTNLGIVEVCGLEPREQYFTTETRIDSKVISITSIIHNKKVLDFICHNNVLQLAYGVQQETGLSVATILAQKGLESNFNQSTFSSRTKNLSNIKCIRKECKKYNIRLTKRGQVGSETKHCIQLFDDGPNDRYVKHSTYWQGWSQYKGLIKRVYSKAASKEGVREEAKALKARGFARDPDYANKIVAIAVKNNLIELQKYIDEGYTITSESGKYIFLKPIP